MIRFAQRLICRLSDTAGRAAMAVLLVVFCVLTLLRAVSVSLGLTLIYGLVLIGLLAHVLRKGMRFPHGYGSDAAAALTFSRGIAVERGMLLKPARAAVLVCAPFEAETRPVLSGDGSGLLLSMAVSLLMPVMPKADENALRQMLHACHVRPERMSSHFTPEITQGEGGFRTVRIREGEVYRTFAVASADEMIERCETAASGRSFLPLTEEHRAQVLQTMRRIAALQRDEAAPRAYAFAMREGEQPWVYLGMIGTALPRNEQAHEQLRRLQSAGYAVAVLDERGLPADGYALPPAADVDDLLRVTDRQTKTPFLLRTDADASFGDDIIRAQHGWRMRTLYFLQASALLPIVLMGLWLTRMHPLSILPLLQWLAMAVPRFRAGKWDIALNRRGQTRVAALALLSPIAALVCLWFGHLQSVELGIAALMVMQSVAVGGIACGLRWGSPLISVALMLAGAVGGMVIGHAALACWFAAFAGGLIALAAVCAPTKEKERQAG